MMPVINGVMLAAGSSLAASIAAKATVTAALGLIGAWLARKNRAGQRHALLAAAFGVLLLLPIASMVAPPVRIEVPAGAQERIVPALASAAAAIPPAAPARTSVGVTPVVPRSAGLSLSALLLAAWIAGAALFLLPVVTGLWQVRWLRRSALPWREGQPAVEILARDAGIHRRVEVLVHEALPGPMTCGVFDPVIVLPQDAQTWDGEKLDRALIHELEHVRRGDWLSQCLARAVCAVYWFHPLVWIARRQLALEAERACDDAVLGRSEAAAYADQLVGLAKRLSMAAKSPLLAMANRADLAIRVGAVLDRRQRRGRAGRFSVALACVAAAAVVLTLSPLRMVAAPQSPSTDRMPRFSANSMLVMEAVRVADRNGKSIGGLSANDFVLTEDGVEQTIRIFEFQELAATSQGTQDPISSYYILGYYTRNQNADGQLRKIQVVRKGDALAKLDYRPAYYSRYSDGAGSVGNAIVPDTTIPILLYQKEPEYSEEARKAKYQGTVLLNVEVDGSGQVTKTRVIRSLGLGLDEKAIEAVRQWKFRPGIRDGRPVTVHAQVDVSFRLL